jgi:integrase
MPLREAGKGKAAMRVRKVHDEAGTVHFELLDDEGETIPEARGFLRYLEIGGKSPNTVSAYAHDLKHFFSFLAREGLTCEEFSAPASIRLLEYLRSVPCRGAAQRSSLALVSVDDEGVPLRRLSPATVNRALAAVSSFYEYLILSGGLAEAENPIRKKPDPAYARVPERHRPFMGNASRQRPLRRSVKVKTVMRLPRPMSDEQIKRFFAALKRLRDRAAFLLMLQGGLRPGEVLNLKLEDVQYGRRRVVIRHREDHPKGVRTKSRTERVVDLHEPEALAMLSAYVMEERPRDAESPFVFLVGGHGKRRLEPLSYSALVKLFARVCERAGIREPWLTPHALRHTHATRMWEGGMRELVLQKRLGHASPESTRVYTRVSDEIVVAEYRRALGEPPQETRGELREDEGD